MRILTCEETRAALSDLVAGELGMAEGRSLEAHLAGCARCTGVGEEIFWQDRVLAERAIELHGERLAARIRDILTGVRPKQVTEHLSAVRVRPRRRGAALRAAAAAA
ncbi:MAG TPA: zf-HC2 domain-containing protein, partial [Planctomycetota bacterium]|nr:zf-HC2 domain-containing protein [Planctomycetota bacterium]